MEYDLRQYPCVCVADISRHLVLSLLLLLSSPCYAHTLHSTPLEVYVLLVCVLRIASLSLCSMLLLCGPLQSHDPGLHPWIRTLRPRSAGIRFTVAIATPKHSEQHHYGSPVPGSLDALLSHRYYIAVARGLSARPLPSPSS